MATLRTFQTSRCKTTSKCKEWCTLSKKPNSFSSRISSPIGQIRNKTPKSRTNHRRPEVGSTARRVGATRRIQKGIKWSRSSIMKRRLIARSFILTLKTMKVTAESNIKIKPECTRDQFLSSRSLITLLFINKQRILFKKKRKLNIKFPLNYSNNFS